jgi:uncharacterized membrane protein
VIRWLLWTLAGLLIGVVVHLTTIVTLPRLSGQTGFQRASAIAPLGRFVVLTADKTPLPLPDPAIVTAFCRYDLADGPVHVHVPLNAGFLSVSFYTPAGLNFYTLTDRAGANGALDMTLFTLAQLAEIRAKQGPDLPVALRLQAPEPTGLIVVRALVPEPTQQADVERGLEPASCR